MPEKQSEIAHEYAHIVGFDLIFTYICTARGKRDRDKPPINIADSNFCLRLGFEPIWLIFCTNVGIDSLYTLEIRNILIYNDKVT